MKYKKSIFNLIVGKGMENETIIFNTLSSSMVAINDYINNIISSNVIIDTEQLNIDDSYNIETLVESGILVNGDLDELISLEMLGMREKYRTDKQLQITIAPTMDCNMMCPYCFQTNKIIPTYMSHDICDSIIKFIEERLETYPFLSVTWFGGEPLLALDQIVYCSEKIIELCMKYNVKYSSSIITNGYNLDLETTKLLFDKCRVSSAQIIIDGLEEEHNIKRILKEEGQNSFLTIINNIKTASEYIDIVVRVNVDNDNRGKLKDLIDFLLVKENLKGKISIGISPVFDFEDKKNIDYNNYCSKEVWNVESIEAMKHFISMDRIDNFTATSFQPSLVSCSANVYDSFIFDPVGDIYKCFLSIGKKQFSIGNVIDILRFDNLLNNLNHKKWIDMSPAEECKSCVYLPLCQSGCLYERLEKGISHKCLKNKGNIRNLLKEIYINNELDQSK